jgi:hypothetical protein
MLPRAIPTTITFGGRRPTAPIASGCRALVRQLPRFGVALTCLDLSRGIPAAIGALRVALPRLVQLTCLRMSTNVNQFSDCRFPPRLTSLSLRLSPGTDDPRTFRDNYFCITQLPATLTDLRLDLARTINVDRKITIADHLTQLLKLALPNNTCHLFTIMQRKEEKHGVTIHTTVDVSDSDSDVTTDISDSDVTIDIDDSDVTVDIGGSDVTVGISDSKHRGMSHLTGLLVRKITHAIHPHVFEALTRLTIDCERWALRLPSVLVGMPLLLELTLGCASGALSMGARSDDVADERGGRENRYPYWRTVTDDAKLNVLLDDPKKVYPRTIRRLTVSRLCSRPILRRIARRMATEVELLRVLTTEGVGDLTPFALHRVALLELPERELRRVDAADYGISGFGFYAPPTTAPFQCGALERVHTLVLREMPDAPLSDTVVARRSKYRGGTFRHSSTHRALYARPDRLLLDFELADCETHKIQTEFLARFRVLSDRYPDIRHLTLPHCIIRPLSMLALILGDILMRFKLLISFDVSAVTIPRNISRSEVAMKTCVDGSSSSTTDGTQDATIVADFLRRHLYPEQLELVSRPPVIV